jgi:hypothetical protein
MSLDVDAVKAAIDATTPGPWEARTEIDGWRAGRDTVVWAHDKRVLTVAQTRQHHDREAEANAAFAAAARTLVPSLLAQVEHLREVAANFERAEWACVGCGYHNRGLVCTHCARPLVRVEAATS